MLKSGRISCTLSANSYLSVMLLVSNGWLIASSMSLLVNDRDD